MIERRVRLWSGLVIAAYVLVHLLNHALGLGSLETAEATLRWVLKVWGNPVGQVLLYGSFLVHFSMSLLAVYRRGTLRMPPWEAVQIGLGLMVVPLILIHVIGTRVIGFSLGFEPTYAYVVASIWVSDPLRGAQQAFALVVVWGHLCAGIHFWLRHRPWYPRLLPILYPVAIIVPILALLGFAGMGATVAERARQAGYLASVFADVTAAPAGTIAWFKGLEPIAFGVFVALIALTLIAREARRSTATASGSSASRSLTAASWSRRWASRSSGRCATQASRTRPCAADAAGAPPAASTSAPRRRAWRRRRRPRPRRSREFAPRRACGSRARSAPRPTSRSFPCCRRT